VNGETEVVGENVEDVDVKSKQPWMRSDGQVEDGGSTSLDTEVAGRIENGQGVVVDGSEETPGLSTRNDRVAKLDVTAVEVTEKKQRMRE
jgi:hypothetical protein